jgi:carboxypeptidase Taq
MTFETQLAELRRRDAEIRTLTNAAAVLGWDQETYLPEGAIAGRSDQAAALEGIVHDKATDPAIGRLLEAVGSTSADPAGDAGLLALDRDFLKALRRDYDRATRLPTEFVQEEAKAVSLSQEAWAKARAADDFPAFAPHLETVLALAKRKAGLLGFADRPYDCLIDLHEPGMDEAAVAAAFGPLGVRLRSLVDRIGRAEPADASFLAKDYPIDRQYTFGRMLMVDLGYDLRRGRLDRTAHPFTTTLGADDVRITTRYFADNPLSSVFSTVHETGHALYEQGFPVELRGSVLADGASMGIHESQSRLWENVVGRSEAFWAGRYPAFCALFPDQLAGVDLGRFYRAVNAVRPSLIRVDADEVTYSLHVILRFELERRLFAGELAVADLPAAWRDGMRRWLGVAPTNDADGVLQDIHWSMGAFGYFPSYALGNLYGLQFWRALKHDLGDVDALLAAGRFAPILDWLRSKIHVLGRRLDPPDLLRRVTGEALSADAFMEYLETKYAAVYRL